MGIYSSGNKYKYRAQEALASAQAIENAQSDIEFRRQLLSNIRQERIARAQLESANYADEFASSSASGAVANIDSSLAGETLYSYETSKRMQQIQNYQQDAQNYMKKYAKQQKTRAMSFAVTGMALGAVTGGFLGAAGLAGSLSASGAAIAGARIGQGLGQVASGTGTKQTQLGIQNILGGGAQAYNMNENAKLLGENNTTVETPNGYNRYETYGVNPATGSYIPNTYAAWMLPQTQRNVISILGGYNGR